MQQSISARKVLIVKTSSLGDIIQSFAILEYLHKMQPGILVDWVVDSSFHSIVAAHPLVRNAIPLTIRGLKKSGSLKKLCSELGVLRQERYDVIFDLQKNTKSGLITLIAKSKVKVGFGFKTVREWPNVLATNTRFDISKQLHSNLQYLALIQAYFKDDGAFKSGQTLFKMDPQGAEIIKRLISKSTSPRMMVCPGSTGVNRQVPIPTLAAALDQVQRQTGGFFYLIWGDEAGRKQCEQLQETLSSRCLIVDRLTIPTWQNLMSEMDLVIAVDSSALHLCATTSTPSFSLFGPTRAANIKPIGDHHLAIQGTCPYGKTFVRQCPIMKTCATGACMRDLKVDEIAQRLLEFVLKLSKNH